MTPEDRLKERVQDAHRAISDAHRDLALAQRDLAEAQRELDDARTEAVRNSARFVPLSQGLD